MDPSVNKTSFPVYKGLKFMYYKGPFYFQIGIPHIKQPDSTRDTKNIILYVKQIGIK